MRSFGWRPFLSHGKPALAVVSDHQHLYELRLRGGEALRRRADLRHRSGHGRPDGEASLAVHGCRGSQHLNENCIDLAAIGVPYVYTYVVEPKSSHLFGYLNPQRAARFRRVWEIHSRMTCSNANALRNQKRNWPTEELYLLWDI